jgi:uncharacterized membrane protein SpoIIM required for sporulation
MTSPGAGKRSGLRRYLLERRAEWDRLAQADADARPDGLTLQQGDALVTGYRQLSRDLASVRRDQPGTRLAAQLEALYRRLHRRIHAPFEPARTRLARLWRDEVPAAAHRLRPALRVVWLIFGGSAAVGALLVASFPELITLFASEQMVHGVQQGRLWTEHLFGIAPASLLAAGIAANNIIVTLTAYVLGIFYGLGTLYIIGLNGLMLGALFAFCAHFGLADELFTFVLAHGPAELSIIAIGGAAGLRLGEALARPGELTHAAAFRVVVRDTGALFVVCVPFLVLCGLAESYVSPDSTIELLPRALMGVGLALLLWSVLLRSDPAARAQA